MTKIFLALFFSSSLQAALSLDIRIINQKGIDKNFTLTSELHSIEDYIVEGHTSTLSMKSGLRLTYAAQFVDEPQTYGPEATLTFWGKITNNKNQTLKVLKRENMSTPIGSEKTIIYDEFDQRIKITLKPYIY